MGSHGRSVTEMIEQWRAGKKPTLEPPRRSSSTPTSPSPRSPSTPPAPPKSELPVVEVMAQPPAPSQRETLSEIGDELVDVCARLERVRARLAALEAFGGNRG